MATMEGTQVEVAPTYGSNTRNRFYGNDYAGYGGSYGGFDGGNGAGNNDRILGCLEVFLVDLGMEAMVVEENTVEVMVLLAVIV